MLPSASAPLRLVYDRGTLLLHGVAGGQDAEWFGAGLCAWDGRVKAWRCDAVWLARVRSALARQGLPFLDDVPVPERVRWPKRELPELRADQRAALEAWRAAGGRGLVVMPTGTGKTEVALAAMADAATATLVVAPVRDLMYQWHARILRGLGYDAGIVGDHRFDVRAVSVTTYDSAYLHMPELGARFGLVVFDEVHHLPGPRYREAALCCAAPLRLGLTATPERADGRHADLAGLVGPVACRQAVSAAAGRTLAEYRVVRVPVRLSAEEQARYDAAGRALRAFVLRRRAEQAAYSWRALLAETGADPEARRAQRAYYARKALEDRAAEKLRVLEDLFRLHVGERVIVFAGSNAMALEVSRRFLVPTLLSHTRKHERRTVLEGFAAGRFPVLVANLVLDEGVDVPAAKVAVVLGGRAAARQATQRLGRILRKTGAARATLYEVVCQETREEERSRRRRSGEAYRSVAQERRW